MKCVDLLFPGPPPFRYVEGLQIPAILNVETFTWL